eukprot:1090640-Rhodomonas_salina.3
MHRCMGRLRSGHRSDQCRTIRRSRDGLQIDHASEGAIVRGSSWRALISVKPPGEVVMRCNKVHLVKA